jgi:hypothetical protein
MPQTNLLASMAVCLVSAKRLNPVLLLLFSMAWSSLASASTWYVNGVSGSDSYSCTSPTNACRTIKHSISLATSGNSIIVAPAIYTENLLTIGNSLKVIGSGANTTIVDGGGTNTVIKISNTGAQVTISKLTIRKGAANFGGGVYNLGMLTLSHVIITANRASRTCNNGCSAGGGGIYNLGTLTISNSTITLNSVQVTGCTQTVTFCGAFARGGGISSATGTFAINNTTISGNTTDSKCRVPAPMQRAVRRRTVREYGAAIILRCKAAFTAKTQIALASRRLF